MKMRTNYVNLSRGLPKTEQETVYRAGDDGIHQAGWWRGKTVAGNKTRFIAKTIGGNDVVIDRATGLMWAADGNEAGCNNGVALNWNDAIDYANSLDFAGFTDWRLPNAIELLSLVDYTTSDPTIDATFFPNCASSYYRSSTTSPDLTDQAFVIDFYTFGITHVPKIGIAKIRAVRGGL